MITQNPPQRNKRAWPLLFGLLAISIALFSYLNQNTDLERQELKIKILEKKLEQLVEIKPDTSTQFYSQENRKGLLWYAKVNDSLLFYNTEGKHPITGEDLLLVTEDVIASYNKKEKIVEEKPMVNKSSDNVKGKVIKKKKKKVVKKKKARESIWNTHLINERNRDEVSLFSFNESEKIDTLLTNRFKEEFEKRGYFITPEIIFSDVMTPEIAANLQRKNIDHFKGNLVKYTDYICIAKAAYSYSQNVYRDDFLDCKMNIEYFIYSSETGEILLSEKDKVIGSDQNKEKSRQRAIEKFVL